MEGPESSSRPVDGLWGPWTTAGLGAVILVASLVSQFVPYLAALVVRLARDPRLDLEQFMREGMVDGTLLAVALLISAAVGIALIWVACVLRRGAPVREHLALHRRPAAVVAGWGVVALLIAGLSDVVLGLLGRPTVPEFMTRAYTSTSFKPLLFLVAVVVAPLFEELLFRGFLFTGLERSRLGAWGTILLTTAVWTGIHGQYGPSELTLVFALGLALGLARSRSASVVPPIAMHVTVNLVAFVEVMLVSARTG